MGGCIERVVMSTKVFVNGTVCVTDVGCRLKAGPEDDMTGQVYYGYFWKRETKYTKVRINE